jgi:nucleotide-binding universal stress UspA family protein
MRYLVAIDGSVQSQQAVRYAVKHAIAFDATLEIVHVVTPETEFVDGEIVLQGQAGARTEGEQTLEKAREHAVEAAEEATEDLAIETQLLTGRPANAITDRAVAADADAIYLGHRGLSNQQEEVVGSVAKSVVSKATVPVTVIR